jgi:hypothetical protein
MCRCPEPCYGAEACEEHCILCVPLVVSQRTVKDEEAESSATSARIVVCRRLMDADQSIQKRRKSVRKVICFSQFSQHVRVGGLGYR